MKKFSIATVALVVVGIIALSIGIARIATGAYPFEGDFWVKVSNSPVLGWIAASPLLLLIVAGWVYWIISLKKK